MKLLTLYPLLLSSVIKTSALEPPVPLCNPPTDPSDDVFINCESDVGSFSPPGPPPSLPKNLTIMTYNIDRNGLGGDGDRELGMGPIISLLNDTSVLPQFDVLLLTEVARGCDDWAEKDPSSAAAKIAEAFGYYYAFGVEYVAYNADSSIGECAQGNGIVSRFPLSDLEVRRFESQCCRYDGRWGGRIALFAVVDIGEGKSIELASAHLESGKPDFKEVIEGTYVRERQAKELAKWVGGKKGGAKFIAGDMNAPLHSVDPTRLAFLHNGFADTFDDLSWSDRITSPPHEVLDFIYVDEGSEGGMRDVGLCADLDKCEGWSDHIPIWGVFEVDDLIKVKQQM